MRHLAVAVALAAATGFFFGGVIVGGLTRSVPLTTYDATGVPRAPDFQFYEVADTTLATWLVPRNARTLTRSPARLFDTEHCAPATKALAFGEPMITLGVLAIPAWLVTGDPVLTYNVTLIALFFLGALAMALLVTDWTGSTAAGLIAGLLYAFSGERVSDITHAFIYDTTWIVLGLFFARRLLVTGTWGYAVGLALSGALQLGTSFYPILASLLFALPVAAWLLAAYPPRARQIVALGAAALVVLAAAYAIFTPYLEARAANATLTRDLQRFAEWSWFVPGGLTGLAYSAALLALVGLLAPLWTSRLRSPDAHAPSVVPASVVWAIAAGALLAAATSVGPMSFPNVYAALARVLPGLDFVRAPARVDAGFHAGVCMLAGFGAAAIARGRFASAIAAVVVALVAVETLALTPTGAAPMKRFELLEVAPPKEDIELFRTLDRIGDRGTLFEVPIGNENEEYIFTGPRRALLSIFHGRRTSACYGSFLPPGRERLRQIALELPSPAAAAKLRGLGFETLVVHLDTPSGRYLADRLREVSYTPGSGIAYLASGKNMLAFRLGEE